MSFFIVSSSSPNSALLSLIELTAVRQDCLSLYSSMSRGFNWCHRALNLSSSCWKACTLDSTLLFITSTFKDYSNNYYIVLERIFTSRNDIMSCTVSHSFKDQKTKCSPHRVFYHFIFLKLITFLSMLVFPPKQNYLGKWITTNSSISVFKQLECFWKRLKRLVRSQCNEYVQKWQNYACTALLSFNQFQMFNCGQWVQSRIAHLLLDH